MLCPFSVRVLSLTARSFSWKLASPSSVLASLRSIRFTPSHYRMAFYSIPATSLAHALPSACPVSLLRHSIHSSEEYRISACYPSTTPFGLALVPDFPRADEPSSGILGFSVRWILTIVPLLTPAFSLPAAPHVFRSCFFATATLPYHRSFCP